MDWISIDTAVRIHERQLEDHGGGIGTRDLDRLKAALGRAETILGYEPDVDIAKLAAAYAYGIAKGHPFIDGNKRTAFVVTELFLVVNGFHLFATDRECIDNMYALASGDLTEEEFADWLRGVTVPKE